VEERLPDLKLASPRDAKGRGCHVSFHHDDGYPIMQALIDRGVIGDFRAPDILRFGFAPLYLRYADIVSAADILADVITSGQYREPRFSERAKVT
jgi:kynureninase